jgi:hypothetical protein
MQSLYYSDKCKNKLGVVQILSTLYAAFIRSALQLSATIIKVDRYEQLDARSCHLWWGIQAAPGVGNAHQMIGIPNSVLMNVSKVKCSKLSQVKTQPVGAKSSAYM